jgi:hypothetical protein
VDASLPASPTGVNGKFGGLTYPWYKGLKVDEILAHHEETGFKD